MRQDHNEAIRSFGARIRGQAMVCKFLLQCPSCDTEVNYTDQILRDVLTKEISNPEIQLDLLGESNQNMTLEEVFRFIEAKEAGKRSASKLLESQGADSVRSQYRKGRTNHLSMLRNNSALFVGRQVMEGMPHLKNGKQLAPPTTRSVITATAFTTPRTSAGPESGKNPLGKTRAMQSSTACAH